MGRRRFLPEVPAGGMFRFGETETSRPQETVDALLPPSDGTSRNYAGLLDNLRSYGIPPSEQYAIILKSNFGAIGGAIWRGIATLRGSGGKIKLPGRYLLSVVSRKEEAAVS